MAGDFWVACVGGDSSSWARCRVSHRQQLLHWVEMSRNFFDWLVSPHEDRRQQVRSSSGKKSLPQSQISLAVSPLQLDDRHHVSVPSSPHSKSFQDDVIFPQAQASPVTKEDLGRATWTFLHTLAAQYPDKPTRQQQKDVQELMGILSRMYPCKECADHFKEVLKSNPVCAKSGVDLSQWMCRVHNIVNRSLGKKQFSCERVDARWGALHCDGACDVHGRLYSRK